MSNLLLYAIPGFLALLFLELAWARRARPRPKDNGAARAIFGYEAKDTFASLSMGIGNVLISAVTTLGAIALFAWGYEHRLFELGRPTLWWSWLALFFAEDLCYYWFHRLHHHVRGLWAAHVNHHSSQRFNLSTALRQPWLTPITGPIFWLPLALLGYPPAMILTAEAISLIYQFWIHTELVRKLPAPLEWLFNTPSHHRVHHGKNVAYLDRNHGGVLILWDRLFGTFAAERADEPVRYGLTHDIATFNPLRIATHEVVALARDVTQAPSLATALRYLLCPPGWSPDGSSLTAAELRRAQQAGPARNDRPSPARS